MISTILGIVFVIGGIILLHELGHFITAKIMGIRVKQFSIGFPPKMLSRKIGETEYRLSWVPLGGYVKLAGMIDESLDKEGLKGEPWEFESKKAYQKAIVISGGVLMNFLSAVIIFTLLIFASGIPEIRDYPVPRVVVDGYPAAEAGIAPGDTILNINREKIDSWLEMTEIIRKNPGKPLTVSWKHQNKVINDTIIPRIEKALEKGDIIDVGKIGIAADYTIRSAGISEAFKGGISETFRWLEITYISVKMIITGKESFKNIGGPIMIARLAGESAKQGLGSLLNFFAIISVNLAFLNLLPVLPLDGGHLAIILVEKLSGKSVPVRIRMTLQTVGMALFLILMFFVLKNDILR